MTLKSLTTLKTLRLLSPINSQIMKKMMLLSTLFALSLLSCSSDNETKYPDADASLTVSTEQITVAEGGKSYDITAQSDNEFVAYVSDDSWLSLSETNFTANTQHTVTLTVATNSSNDSRTGTVTFASKGTRKTITVTQDGAPLDSDIPAPSGYKLVWHDEFNSSTLGDDWTYELHPARWVNSELQTYVKSDETCFLSEGTLKIRCVKQSDGSINSSRLNICRNTGWKYGYFEASIKVPAGKGTWPAFWMMPVNYVSWPGDGEIDIMEYVGKDPHKIYSTIHCNKYNNTGTSIESGNTTVSSAESEFHKYSLEWTDKYMTFKVDDTTILTYHNDGTGTDAWPFDAPFYIILNNAWGGTWGGASGVDESALPSTFEIDYVRVFQKE